MFLAPARVWPWLFRWYWGSCFVLGLVICAAELIFGESVSRIGAVLFIAYTTLAIPFIKNHSRVAVPLHIIAGLATAAWMAHQPVELISPTFNREVALYIDSTLVTLALFVLSAFAGPVGAVIGFAMTVFLYPHPENVNWFAAFPFWVGCCVLGYGLYWGINRLEAMQKVLEDVALKDSLTGLGNRRAFENDYDRYRAIAGRENVPMLLSIWDLDGLKAINDAHGHSAGDDYLLRFSVALKESVRQGDALFRTGGDEFCALHLGLSDGSELVKRVRFGFSHVSVGYIECSGLTLDEAFKKADKLLYKDKRLRGRLTDPDETLSL